MENLEKLLTPKEAIGLLRVSHQTLRRWIKAGKIKAV
ncbi:MAG: IS607 family transposase, partial [Candidatus Hecatellales archaeon]